MNRYLGFDLGASSGRAIVGILENDILKLDEIYRFPNNGIKISNSLYWDILRIFQEIKNGLSEYVKKYGPNLESIGINTWGVDFILLDENDEIIGPIHHYRDRRTDGMLESMFNVVPKKEIFNQTGIQVLSINTSTQIFSMVYNKSPRLSIAKTFLMLPDYFNYLLSGVKVSEYSDATTSQLYNPNKNDWAYDLIKKLGLKQEWFCKIVQPGTILGTIQKSIAEEIGLNNDTKIIAPLCHDTGSAVAAVPADIDKYGEGEWAYLSSGSWSLIGVELEKPLINDKVLKYNFTNEGGINGTIRFLKNVTGMWLIQECKKIWDKEGFNLSWDDIAQQTEKSTAFKYFINPDNPSFLNSLNMIEEIKQYCNNSNQGEPQSVGEIGRTIFESLAFRYKQTIEYLEDITNRKIKILYIIGGGSQNNVLNQFTANVLNIPVKTGPSEATTIGNILVQALAIGEIKDIKELRQIVINSFPIKEYTPNESNKWNDAYKIYLEKTK